MNDFALWTVLIEIIKSSQYRGLSVTCDVVWYKKINWAPGTYRLGEENQEISRELRLLVVRAEAERSER